jgi:hypothetical protein
VPARQRVTIHRRGVHRRLGDGRALVHRQHPAGGNQGIHLLDLAYRPGVAQQAFQRFVEGQQAGVHGVSLALT